MSLKREGAIAFVWDFIGRIASQGVGFVVSIFLARLLMPEDFGTIAMITVVISIASVFLDVGLSGALIQRKRLLPVHYNSVFYFNLSIGLLLSVLLYFCAPLLEQFYAYDGLAVFVRGLSPLFFLNALNSVQRTRLRRQLHFKKITHVSVLTGMLSGICGVWLAFAGFGIWSLIYQQLLQAGVSVVLLWTATGWRPGFQFSLKALKQLWGFGFNMFLSGLLDTVFTRLDALIIGKFFTASTLGLYNRSKSLNALVTNYSSGSLMQVTYPLLSKLQFENERFNAVIYKVLSLVSYAAFFLGGLFFLLGEELIILVYSEKWIGAVPYFKIIILNSYSYPVNSVLVNIMKGKGNSRNFLQVELWKKAIYMINLVVGFTFFGIEGFLTGLVVIALISTQLNIYYAKKDMSKGQWWFIKIIYSNALMAGLCAGVCLMLRNYVPELAPLIGLSLYSLLYTILYLCLSFAFKSDGMLIAKKELENLVLKKFGKPVA